RFVVRSLLIWQYGGHDVELAVAVDIQHVKGLASGPAEQVVLPSREVVCLGLRRQADLLVQHHAGDRLGDERAVTVAQEESSRRARTRGNDTIDVPPV